MFQEPRLQRKQTGFTLAEALISIALMGVLAAISIMPLINRTGKSESQKVRLVDDFIGHMEAACESVKMRYGTGPFNARTSLTTPPAATATTYQNMHYYQYTFAENTFNDPATTVANSDDPDGFDPVDTDGGGAVYTNYSAKCVLHDSGANDIPETYDCATDTQYRGMEYFLQSWESAATYASTTATAPCNNAPNRMAYPGGIMLYFRPDMAAADPNNEIPDDGSNGSPAWGKANFNYDDIMAKTDDRLWMLLDINDVNNQTTCALTTKGANSLSGAGDDRVLLYLDDATCKVYTARQQCQRMNPACGEAFASSANRSFYDLAKCTELGANCANADFD